MCVRLDRPSGSSKTVENASNAAVELQLPIFTTDCADEEDLCKQICTMNICSMLMGQCAPELHKKGQLGALRTTIKTKAVVDKVLCFHADIHCCGYV